MGFVEKNFNCPIVYTLCNKNSYIIYNNKLNNLITNNIFFFEKGKDINLENNICLFCLSNDKDIIYTLNENGNISIIKGNK